MKKILLLLVLYAAALFSCRPEKLATPSEPVKAINGSWQIIRATRNGTDLSDRFDFSQFRIHFADSTYTIDSLVPFVVSRSGTWAFDDPTYPFNISFMVSDSTARKSPLLYPVTGGKRNIILTLSPGCNLNSYQYTLQKAN